MATEDSRRSSRLRNWRRSWRDWRLGDDIFDFEPLNFDVLWNYWSETTLGNYSSETLETFGDGGRYYSSEETLLNRTLNDAEDEKHEKPAEDWHLTETVRAIQKQREKDEVKDRKLGVTWQHLTVKGRGADSAIAENVGSQFNVFRSIKGAFSAKPDDLKTIIHDSHGCVRPGELLLVIGRPGAGCTTLLKNLANRASGYADVSGDIRYGNMSANEAKRYRGQIVMNTEDDVSFPTLKVGQTIDFATRLKNPRRIPSSYSSRNHYHEATRDFLLQSMHIDHTRDTKVGNEFVRGVSGGERRRVSIIETLATKASVYCWDNPTRGLDASTALEFVKAIRTMSDTLGHAHIVTLYQAGNGIFDLFDKVLVLDQGWQVYYGPANQAQAFMEHQGFQYTPGANVADFLTSVTVPTERKLRNGVLDFPRNAEELQIRYDLSMIKAIMLKESNYPHSDEAHHLTAAFRSEIVKDKHRSVPKKSPLTVSFAEQVNAAIIRQFQLMRGDWVSFAVTQVSTIIQGLVISSIFYNAPDNSSGLFLKGGALFFCMLYQSLVAMSEVTASFGARPVLAKHRGFAFYHPAAFCVAQLVVDVPTHFIGVTIFVLPLYWLVGLKDTAAAFFTLWVVTFATAMCMTAMFRAIGASMPTFDAASKLSGFAISALTMYMGYVITKPQMHPWFVWIFWINPLAYGFEALMGNEFGGEVLPCVSNNLVPSGPGYEDLSFAACTGVSGAPLGATSVTGEQYLNSLAYSPSHVWRNFGILWAWWFLFVVLSIVFTSRWNQQTGNSGVLLTPRGSEKSSKHTMNDEESRYRPNSLPPPPYGRDQIDLEKDGPGSVPNNDLVRNKSIFTWRDLSYTIKTGAGERTLLDQVHGWVKPGMLGALMGSSGAGKTTLLDVLAQRKTEGTIRGSVLVDGRALPMSFQRSAGYCEQLDVHEPLTTVREALIFSALLRQPRSVTRDEKIKYVDTIIDLLEMRDIEHAMVGTPAAGLSVEQRKRLTIGVELVAKPSTLIFLDEPTSGLDGQAAYNIVRFLRKLADAGQAVLVTIHQPSASLFAQFDTLLLLTKGGKTVYFGDIGNDCQTLKDYFGRNGAAFPHDSNPAEHMIDIVSGSLSRGRDWNKVWLNSAEHQAMLSTLDHLVTESANQPVDKSVDDSREFAVSLWQQTQVVTQRMNTTLWRNTDYINSKLNLHITSALFNGFTFWMIGDGFGEINTVAQLQMRLFTIFQFIFVAPGVIAQLQPLFLQRRDIYETREKKAKMYHWAAFTTALIVTEIPYLVICSILYFFCWYYTVGFPLATSAAGSSYFVVLMYELIYTGVGQFIAAYAPDAISASMVNPLLINVLSAFCGVLVPYIQMPVFWRYWLYYINPFTYLLGSLLVFTSYDVTVSCGESEFAVFDPPSDQNCGSYLANYLTSQEGFGKNLTNPGAVSGCRVCEYTTGADYLATLNLSSYGDGWRDAGICALFAVSSYACVYLLMKLRTKATKTAE